MRTNTIPALDRTPAGHLPHVVDQAPRSITAAIGPAELSPGQLVIWWPTSPGGSHIEAAYDRKQISLADAETRLRAQLAERGMRITSLVSEDAAKPVACPIYRDCTVTAAGHYDHSGFDRAKVMDETGRGLLIGADMVALSGNEQYAVVCLGNAEFSDLAALRAKTAELRRFLDEVDALADRVFGDHQARA